MTLLDDNQKKLIQKLDDIGLTSSVMRDFSSLLPFIFNEQWHTSISLRAVMRMDNSYTRKELSKVSNMLSNIYHNTKLLERREKRKMYFRFWQNRHISHWAYRLDWEYLSSIMPNPEEDEMNQIEAQRNFERSLE